MLGETQKAVLAAMRRHNGMWHEGCGWIWDTVSRTRRIMETLAKQGAVNVSDEAIKGKYHSWTRRTYSLPPSHGQTAPEEK